MKGLSDLTTLHLGGPPHRLVDCRSETEVIEAVSTADAAGERLLLLGGGSNLVVPDEGFPGTVARILTRGIKRREVGNNTLLEVAAGEPWDPLVEHCVRDGLSGFECLSGIPGSVGATPIQNVGAYGQEVRETLVRVRVYDRERRELAEMLPTDCDFSYRSSIFKRTPGRWVVLAVTFALDRQSMSKPIRYPELARCLGIDTGEPAPLESVRVAVMGLRRAKGMVLDPSDPDTVSAGSFFLNPILNGDEVAALMRRVERELGPDTRPPLFPQPDGRAKASAAWLIEHAGFSRGYGNPRGIAISTKHTLALTNRGEGTAAELLALAEEIAEGVWGRFGVALHPEPVLVNLAWKAPGGAVASF